MQSDIDEHKSLARLVQENPMRARVFESRGLDFCCGGKQSLSEACQKEGFELDSLRQELAEVDEQSESEESVEFSSLIELVDHIEKTHHDYLRDELGPLGDLVAKVENAHGERHPELHELAEAFETLAGELPVHLSEEEQILFPAVRHLEGHGVSSVEGKTARELLQGLEQDHDKTAECLEQIRELTDDFEVPDDACPSYRNMLARLEELERDIHMHVHRENNVLFPEVRNRLSK